MRDYVKEFSFLMLDIKNMSEEDKLFNFVFGLQTWAQTVLKKAGSERFVCCHGSCRLPG